MFWRLGVPANPILPAPTRLDCLDFGGLPKPDPAAILELFIFMLDLVFDIPGTLGNDTPSLVCDLISWAVFGFYCDPDLIGLLVWAVLPDSYVSDMTPNNTPGGNLAADRLYLPHPLSRSDI